MPRRTAPCPRGRAFILFAAPILGIIAGCSSKSPCADPKGSVCARTNAYPADDPRSVCHVCCESSSSTSDAWTEVSQTDIGSGQFTAVAGQNRPYPGITGFDAVQAYRFTSYFIFNDTTSNPDFGYHLLTRGRQNEGDLQVYVRQLGFGYPPISAEPLDCTLAQN